MSVDYAKLKTNLSLIMHRLKLVEKKKMENNQKARKTIGEFLNAGKVDRARIRVEQIIREDYIVEAMDLVESYCDLLLSRFGRMQASEAVDEGLATAISSIVWVTPFFENDVPELKTISDQLGRKYGKQYVAAARDNTLKTVNDTLMKKMSVQVPPAVLVEKYLVEIAKDQKIDYKPDQKIMKEQEANSSGGSNRPNDDDDNRQGGQRTRSGPAPQSGFNLIDLGDHYPRSPITQPFTPYGQAPPLPSEPPLGPTQTSGPVDLMSDVTDASAPSARLPIGFNLSNASDSTNNSTASQSTSRLSNQTEKSSAAKPVHHSTDSDQQQQHGANSDGGSPPNYDSVVNKTQYYSFDPDSDIAPEQRSHDNVNDTLPELPPVPRAGEMTNQTNTSTNAEDGLDFEDLTRRFEDLKNKN